MPRHRAPVDLELLRHRTRAITAMPESHPVVPLGAAAFDQALARGGLGCGQVHEVAGEPGFAAGDAARCGFTVALAHRVLAKTGGDVLWCTGDGPGRLSARGLASFGFDPSRILFVQARNDTDRLWVMEEGLRCGDLAAVVGEVGAARTGHRDSVACRRLRLAAADSGVTGFLLRDTPGTGATPDTRWQVTPAPSPDMSPHWHVRLTHARNGRAASGTLAWNGQSLCRPSPLVPGTQRRHHGDGTADPQPRMDDNVAVLA